MRDNERKFCGRKIVAKDGANPWSKYAAINIDENCTEGRKFATIVKARETRKEGE